MLHLHLLVSGSGRFAAPPAPEGRLPLYTPAWVPLAVFLEAHHDQYTRKTADGSPSELPYVQFPVEHGFWASKHAPYPCVEKAVELADGIKIARRLEHKYSCGDPSHWKHVWSIGSNGETQFEEYVHAKAPNASISVFDCTLTSTQRAKVSALEADGVLRLFDVCMGADDKPASIMGHGTAVPLIRAWEAARHGTRKPLDYLKIDCEGCEIPLEMKGSNALLPFLQRVKDLNDGMVPISQLQIEIHLGVFIEKNTTNIETYAHGGGMDAVMAQHTPAWSASYKQTTAALRALLAALHGFGFVPFHVDLNHKGLPGAEWSFANVGCTSCRWPS